MCVYISVSSFLALLPLPNIDSDIVLVLVEIRFKAIQTAIAMVSGAYQTSIVSYFTHRDLFPSLMKVCNFQSDLN